MSQTNNQAIISHQADQQGQGSNLQFEQDSQEDGSQLDIMEQDDFVVNDDEQQEEQQDHRRHHNRHKHHKKDKKKKKKKKIKRMQLDPEDLDLVQEQNSAIDEVSQKFRSNLKLHDTGIKDELDDEEIEPPVATVYQNQLDEYDQNVTKFTRQQYQSLIAVFGNDRQDDQRDQDQPPEKNSALREVDQEDEDYLPPGEKKPQKYGFDQGQKQLIDVQIKNEQKNKVPGKRRKAQNFEQKILDTCFPQRYFRSLHQVIETQCSQKEIEPQCNWMHARLVQEGFRIDKNDLKTVLFKIRKNYFDVPYIQSYIAPFLKNFDYLLIEEIFAKNRQWFGYLLSIQALNNRIQKLRNFLQENKNADELGLPSLKEIVNIFGTLPHQDLIDELRECLMFYIQAFQCDKSSKIRKMASLSENPNQIALSTSSSPQVEIVRIGVHQWSRKIFLNPKSLAQNIKSNQQINQPTTPKIQPRKAVNEFLSKTPRFKNQISMLTGIVDYLSSQLIHNIQVLNFFKQYYQMKAKVSSETTKKGEELINIYHPLFPAKRIKNKPLSEFFKVDDRTWGYLKAASQQSLIQIKIQLQQYDISHVSADLLRLYQDNTKIVDNAQLSVAEYQYQQKVMKQWNMLRKEVIKKTIQKAKKKVQTYFIRKLDQLSKKSILNKCKDQFQKMLMRPPMRIKLIKDNNLLEYNPKIMALLIDDKNLNEIHFKPANVYGVMLSRSGQMIKDFVIPRAVERRTLYRKKVDSHIIEDTPINVNAKTADAVKLFKKYLTQFQPQAIVVGANCLQARYLYDKLQNEIIPLIIKESNKDHQIKSRQMYGSGQFSPGNNLQGQLEQQKQSRGKLNRQESDQEGEIEQAQSFKAPQIFYQLTDVPVIYSKSRISKTQQTVIAEQSNICISLGRMKLDPMTQILHNWTDDAHQNKILNLIYHPLQYILNKEEFHLGLEQVAVRVVNKIGVELSSIREYSHMRGSLKFVSGLGPVLATNLLKKIKKTDIIMRSQIYALDYLKKGHFHNCIPFIRIKQIIAHPNAPGKGKRPKNKKKIRRNIGATALDSDYDDNQDIDDDDDDDQNNMKQNLESCQHPFDETRIDILQYTYAQKLCQIVLQQSTDKAAQDILKQDMTPIVKFVMQNPRYLQQANLRQMAQKMFIQQSQSQEDLNNQLFVLQFIKQELLNPFKDPRSIQVDNTQETSNPSAVSAEFNKLIFLNMINETVQTFYPGMITTGTVQRVNSISSGKTFINIRLNNGAGGLLMGEDIDLQMQDNHMSDGGTIADKIKQGSLVTARIKQIDYTKFQVLLTAKLQQLRSHQPYIRLIWP